MVWVFINGPRDWGSISGQVISKTQKIELDTSLLNIQHYKVQVKGKVEQSWEWRSTPLHLCVVDIEKGSFGSPLTTGGQFTSYTNKKFHNEKEFFAVLLKHTSKI